MNSKLKFKETEIGLIPEDWKVGTLKNLAEFKNGKSSPERNEIGKYFVFGSNGNIGKSDEFNSEEKTIIIGRVGSYCGSVYFSKEKCWVTDNAIIGKANENSVSEYLFYLLKRLELNRHRGGSGQPLLNQTVLYNIKVALFKKDEQSAIAKILSDLDSKIELLQKQNETLEKIGQAIFKQWFVDFEFPNEEGKPYKSSGGEMVDSELGEIPKGWEIKKLKDIVSQLKPGTNYQPKRVTEGIPFVNVRNIKKGFLDLSDVKFITNDEFLRVHKVWKPEVHDVLITRIGTLGNVAVIRKKDLPIAVHYNSINLKQKKPFSFQFLYFLLKSKSFQEKYHLKKKQSVQEYVTIDEVENLYLVLPMDENEISSLLNIFNSLFNKIEINQNKIESLQKTRDLLLPKLMTGKIRVPLEVEE